MSEEQISFDLYELHIIAYTTERKRSDETAVGFIGSAAFGRIDQSRLFPASPLHLLASVLASFRFEYHLLFTPIPGPFITSRRKCLSPSIHRAMDVDESDSERVQDSKLYRQRGHQTLHRLAYRKT
jgi:hypothetical protein